jgi:hypothetical protein
MIGCDTRTGMYGACNMCPCCNCISMHCNRQSHVPRMQSLQATSPPNRTQRRHAGNLHAWNAAFAAATGSKRGAAAHKHNGDRHRQHKGEQQHRWQLGESKQQIRAADTAVQALKCKVAARRSKATCSYTSRRPQHSTTNTSQHHSERIDRGYRLMATLLFV